MGNLNNRLRSADVRFSKQCIRTGARRKNCVASLVECPCNNVRFQSRSSIVSMMIASSSVTTDWASLILHGVNPTGKEIGRGAYGRVFEVKYEGTLCAAKEVHALLLQYAQGDDLQKIRDDFLSECQIWSTLRHPCIVQFLGTVVLYYSVMIIVIVTSLY